MLQMNLKVTSRSTKESTYPDRIDIVFHTYQQLTLKVATRQELNVAKEFVKECRMIRLHPLNWHSFLRSDENKIQLFRYLSQYLVKNHGQNNTRLVCSFDTMSISSDPDANLSFISPCNHEEAS